MSDRYWQTPEDLTPSWALLGEALAREAIGHGGKMLTIVIGAERGTVSGLYEVTAVSMEPRSAIVQTRAKTWWQVIRRVRSVSSENFVGIVRINVLLDAREHPTQWTEPNCLQYTSRRDNMK